MTPEREVEIRFRLSVYDRGGAGALVVRAEWDDIRDLLAELDRARAENSTLRKMLDGVEQQAGGLLAEDGTAFFTDGVGEWTIQQERARAARAEQEIARLREAHLQAAKKFASVLEEEAELSDRLRRERDALREALEDEARLGFTLKLGPLPGPTEDVQMVRLAPLRAALASAADAPPREGKE